MMFKYLIFVLAGVFFFGSSTMAQTQQGAAAFDASQCGVTKRCITIPNNCQATNNCNYMISYSPSQNGQSMNIELYGRRDSPQMQYVAMGFSSDDKMGNEAVAACIASPNGQAQLSYSYNLEGRQNVPLGPLNPADSQLLSGAVTANSIYCRFTQAITPMSNKSIPNLRQPFRLLVARGPLQSNGQLGRHTDRQATPFQTAMTQ